MWKRLLGNALLLRRAVRELQGIREQMTRQGDLLERMCMHYGLGAPAVTPSEQAAVQRDTGIDFLDAIEAGIVEDYMDRTERDTGRKPTDDEILAYLADEKTHDLAIRLKEREALADLDRLNKAGAR
jgi:hypothetical protein